MHAITPLTHFMILVFSGLTIPGIIRFVKWSCLMYPVGGGTLRAKVGELRQDLNLDAFARYALATRRPGSWCEHLATISNAELSESLQSLVLKEASFLNLCHECEASILRSRRAFYLGLWICALSVTALAQPTFARMSNESNATFGVRLFLTAESLLLMLTFELAFCAVMFCGYRYLQDSLNQRREYWGLYFETRRSLARM